MPRSRTGSVATRRPPEPLRPRKPKSLFRAVVPVLILLAGSCTGGRYAGTEGGFQLRVENQQFEGVTVALLRSGSVIPIGFVHGFGTRTFHIPAAYMGSGLDLALRADPRASRNSRQSIPFHVMPGQTVVWTVQGVGPLSALMVR